MRIWSLFAVLVLPILCALTPLPPLVCVNCEAEKFLYKLTGDDVGSFTDSSLSDGGPCQDPNCLPVAPCTFALDVTWDLPLYYVGYLETWSSNCVSSYNSISNTSNIDVSCTDVKNIIWFCNDTSSVTCSSPPDTACYMTSYRCYACGG